MKLLALAWRNLLLHKVKSLLVGLVMGLGVAALFVGNSLIDTAIAGLRGLFIAGYTGEFMVTGPSRQPVTVFGEASSGLNTDDVPRIKDAEGLAAWMAGLDGIAAVTGQLSARAEMGLGETPAGLARLIGVDLADYRAFFPEQLELVSGSWPAPGESGWILLSSGSAAMLEKAEGRAVEPGQTVQITSLSESAGTVIRELRVAALVRFRQSNPELSGIDITGADTLREILGFASAADAPIALDAEQAAFVEGFDPEALFSEDIELGGIGAAAAPLGLSAPLADAEPDAAIGAAAAGSAESAASVAAGPAAEPAWQFLLVRAEEGADPQYLMRKVEDRLAELGLEARVQDWAAGAGRVASMALALRLVFKLLVVVVGVVVVIVAMNALAISIAERMGEIGTMRALGATRGFVSALIGLETALLALISGAGGLLAGLAVLAAASRSGVPAPSYFFELIFGGPVLSPRVSAGAALEALAWIAGMSLAASAYPIRMALAIEPARAMGQE